MMGLHPTSVNDNPRWREELALGRTVSANPARGHSGLLRRGRNRAGFLLEPRFPRGADRSLPPPDRTGPAIRTADRRAIRAMRGPRPSPSCANSAAGGFGASSTPIRTASKPAGNSGSCGDFVFGIGGVVTFKKSRLAEVVRDMELREIVLETDCPYLTPAPHRGERNESAYVRYVCEKVAEIKGLTPAEVAAATAENAKRIFERNLTLYAFIHPDHLHGRNHRHENRRRHRGAGALRFQRHLRRISLAETPQRRHRRAHRVRP